MSTLRRETTSTQSRLLSKGGLLVTQCLIACGNPYSGRTMRVSWSLEVESCGGTIQSGSGTFDTSSTATGWNRPNPAPSAPVGSLTGQVLVFVVERVCSPTFPPNFFTRWDVTYAIGYVGYSPTPQITFSFSPYEPFPVTVSDEVLISCTGQPPGSPKRLTRSMTLEVLP